MKTKLSLTLAAAVLLFPATHLFAQMTGTSHPEDLDDTQPTVPVDGTHYVPPSQVSPAQVAPAASAATAAPVDPDETTPAPVLYQRSQPTPPAPVQAAAVTSSDPTLNVTDDVDSGIVTAVAVGPNELPIGTTFKADLQQPISTATTPYGTRFTAALSSDVSRNGVVLIPSGSLIYGRITEIHGGRRISGPSAIRLQPDSVSLPDGTSYKINAEVTDLDHFADSHVNDEGTIVGSSNGKATAAILGATTGTAVVAGAVIGGGVGAVVGLGVGAGAATVVWLRQDRQQELPAGTEILFTLNNPLQLNPATH